MEYVTKNCPICGNKFVIMASVADRELGCTIGCLTKVHEMAKLSGMNAHHAM